MVSLNLAILGTRGVPPNYGGFETFAAELGERLVARGHRVTVYCRPGTTEERVRKVTPWRGIERVVLPAIGHKYLETVSHTFLSALDAVGRGFDGVLLCNAANAFVLPLLRAARIPTIINVDGIERRRRKWNVLGRAVYAAGESFSVLFASRVVADAEVIARYYRERYGIATVTIPYGAGFPDEAESDVLARIGVVPQNYLLYVSRFEPENNPLEVVLAYERYAAEAARRGEAAPPLVMLGKGLYAPALVEELRRHENAQVRFPGALYGADYRTLQKNALLYIQATEVGGTHPALIEAMGSGGLVLAHDTPENREVGGDAVGYFRLRPSETLSGMLGGWLADRSRHREWRERARTRARERFDWNAVTDAYESLFLELV